VGQKAEALAARLEQTARDLEANVKSLTEEQWRSKTAEEGWTVAATAHHAAISSGPIAAMAESAATGSPMPQITPDGLHQMNADHAKQFASCSRDETLQALREGIPPAAAIVRGLSDEQLARKATLPLGMELSAEQIIENVLIGHLAGHGASIEAAAASA
jgi:hypothetical protein